MDLSRWYGSSLRLTYTHTHNIKNPMTFLKTHTTKNWSGTHRGRIAWAIKQTESERGECGWPVSPARVIKALMKRVTAQLSLMLDTKGPCSVRGRGFYTGGCALCPTGTHTVHCIYKQTTLQCHTSWSWTTIDTSTGAYFLFIYLMYE